ncbi:hypothetical protein [Nitrosomonas sp.]|uniref:hypothetical protein n=1 Tax=Nitrosomonas sp. TaxID=42353 RepID=UPI001DBE34D6|nr:hypothetical protein [Nitrosomonas sp.]MBX3617391.1 hypothetical protein [Nitrosomonas sp.]
MFSKKLSAGKSDGIHSNNSDIDDEGVLADGMIPDSRIIKLIDELEINNDDFGRKTASDAVQENLKPDPHNGK